MEDDVPERAFYFEALENCSLTSADSKEEDIYMHTNKTRAQEQWEKIRCSVPILLRLNSEAVREEIGNCYWLLCMLPLLLVTVHATGAEH